MISIFGQEPTAQRLCGDHWVGEWESWGSTPELPTSLGLFKSSLCVSGSKINQCCWSRNVYFSLPLSVSELLDVSWSAFPFIPFLVGLHHSSCFHFFPSLCD